MDTLRGDVKGRSLNASPHGGTAFGVDFVPIGIKSFDESDDSSESDS